MGDSNSRSSICGYVSGGKIVKGSPIRLVGSGGAQSQKLNSLEVAHEEFFSSGSIGYGGFHGNGMR